MKAPMRRHFYNSSRVVYRGAQNGGACREDRPVNILKICCVRAKSNGNEMKRRNVVRDNVRVVIV